MSLPSKFPDHECKKCGIMIKKGDPVDKVNGQWCSNPQCPTPPGIPESMMKESDGLTMDEFIVGETSKLLKIEEIVLATVPASTKTNGQKVGMFVKEIYRSWTNKENSS